MSCKCSFLRCASASKHAHEFVSSCIAVNPFYNRYVRSLNTFESHLADTVVAPLGISPSQHVMRMNRFGEPQLEPFARVCPLYLSIPLLYANTQPVWTHHIQDLSLSRLMPICSWVFQVLIVMTHLQMQAHPIPLRIIDPVDGLAIQILCGKSLISCFYG